EDFFNEINKLISDSDELGLIDNIIKDKFFKNKEVISYIKEILKNKDKFYGQCVRVDTKTKTLVLTHGLVKKIGFSNYFISNIELNEEIAQDLNLRYLYYFRKNELKTIEDFPKDFKWNAQYKVITKIKKERGRYIYGLWKIEEPVPNGWADGYFFIDKDNVQFFPHAVLTDPNGLLLSSEFLDLSNPKALKFRLKSRYWFKEEAKKHALKWVEDDNFYELEESNFDKKKSCGLRFYLMLSIDQMKEVRPNYLRDVIELGTVLNIFVPKYMDESFPLYFTFPEIKVFYRGINDEFPFPTSKSKRNSDSADLEPEHILEYEETTELSKQYGITKNDYLDILFKMFYLLRNKRITSPLFFLDDKMAFLNGYFTDETELNNFVQGPSMEEINYYLEELINKKYFPNPDLDMMKLVMKDDKQSYRFVESVEYMDENGKISSTDMKTTKKTWLAHVSNLILEYRGSDEKLRHYQEELEDCLRKADQYANLDIGSSFESEKVVKEKREYFSIREANYAKKVWDVACKILGFATIKFIFGGMVDYSLEVLPFLSIYVHYVPRIVINAISPFTGKESDNKYCLVNCLQHMRVEIPFGMHGGNRDLDNLEFISLIVPSFIKLPLKKINSHGIVEYYTHSSYILDFPIGGLPFVSQISGSSLKDFSQEIHDKLASLMIEIYENFNNDEFAYITEVASSHATLLKIIMDKLSDQESDPYRLAVIEAVLHKVIFYFRTPNSDSTIKMLKVEIYDFIRSRDFSRTFQFELLGKQYEFTLTKEDFKNTDFLLFPIIIKEPFGNFPMELLFSEKVSDTAELLENIIRNKIGSQKVEVFILRNTNDIDYGFQYFKPSPSRLKYFKWLPKTEKNTLIIDFSDPKKVDSSRVALEYCIYLLQYIDQDGQTFALAFKPVGSDFASDDIYLVLGPNGIIFKEALHSPNRKKEGASGYNYYKVEFNKNKGFKLEDKILKEIDFGYKEVWCYDKVTYTYYEFNCYWYFTKYEYLGQIFKYPLGENPEYREPEYD
ncbi:MAG: hypothetical protein ACTSYF_01445, partial [Promethearchaeota archaeon]